ncbi:hypothetical protein C8R43DRAFT_1240053 [Mycena crocata]|nr:hypothetical protein C8R43DRAFT_1240053 [Mycena crocata]
MPRSYASDTHFTLHSNEASSCYGYDLAPNANYVQPPQLERRHDLPPNTPAYAHLWSRLPNTNGPVQFADYEQPDEVRLGVDAVTGDSIVYDNVVPLSVLNAHAPEFRPSVPISRPGSAVSRASSISSGSTLSSSPSIFSSASATSATSNWEPPSYWPGPNVPARFLVAGVRRAPVPRIPAFPEIQPDHGCYITYHTRMSAANLSIPISCIFDVAEGDYTLTQHAYIRAEALRMMRWYWEANDGPWCDEPTLLCQFPVSKGVNIAALMGSLFRYDLMSGAAVHCCLNILLAGGFHFMKLQAIHALFIHCQERICVGKTGLDTALVRAGLCARRSDGKFVWGPRDESRAILEDLLANLDRWFAARTS